MDSNIRVIEKTAAREIDLYLVGDIGSPEEYLDIVQTIQNLSPTDVCYIHINTGGGRADTATQIIHAIQNSHGTVIGVAEGDVYSAGSLIFFACHGFAVNDYATFMLHEPSYGLIGKTNENSTAVKFYDKVYRKMYKDIYGSFFSEEDLEQVFNGKDCYFTAKQVLKRIEKAMKEQEETEVEG